jgi:hypothetical protein
MNRIAVTSFMDKFMTAIYAPSVAPRAATPLPRTRA